MNEEAYELYEQYELIQKSYLLLDNITKTAYFLGEHLDLMSKKDFDFLLYCASRSGAYVSYAELFEVNEVDETTLKEVYVYIEGILHYMQKVLENKQDCEFGYILKNLFQRKYEEGLIFNMDKILIVNEYDQKHFIQLRKSLNLPEDTYRENSNYNSLTISINEKEKYCRFAGREIFLPSHNSYDLLLMLAINNKKSLKYIDIFDFNDEQRANYLKNNEFKKHYDNIALSYKEEIESAVNNEYFAINKYFEEGLILSLQNILFTKQNLSSNINIEFGKNSYYLDNQETEKIIKESNYKIKLPVYELGDKNSKLENENNTEEKIIKNEKYFIISDSENKLIFYKDGQQTGEINLVDKEKDTLYKIIPGNVTTKDFGNVESIKRIQKQISNIRKKFREEFNEDLIGNYKKDKYYKLLISYRT